MLRSRLTRPSKAWIELLATGHSAFPDVATQGHIRHRRARCSHLDQPATARRVLDAGSPVGSMQTPTLENDVEGSCRGRQWVHHPSTLSAELSLLSIPSVTTSKAGDIAANRTSASPGRCRMHRERHRCGRVDYLHNRCTAGRTSDRIDKHHGGRNDNQAARTEADHRRYPIAARNTLSRSAQRGWHRVRGRVPA